MNIKFIFYRRQDDFGSVRVRKGWPSTHPGDATLDRSVEIGAPDCEMDSTSMEERLLQWRQKKEEMKSKSKPHFDNQRTKSVEGTKQPHHHRPINSNLVEDLVQRQEVRSFAF